MWDEGSSVHIHPLSCSCWRVSVKKPWAERLSILILFVVFSIVFCYQLTLCPHTLSTAHTCFSLLCISSETLLSDLSQSEGLILLYMSLIDFSSSSPCIVLCTKPSVYLQGLP